MTKKVRRFHVEVHYQVEITEDNGDVSLKKEREFWTDFLPIENDGWIQKVKVKVSEVKK